MRPVPLAFSQQQTGDDKPRDDEEDFDADVATAEPGYAGVVDEGQEDRDGTDPLDIGSELPVTGWGSRLVAGRRVTIGRDRHHAREGAPPRALALPTVSPRHHGLTLVSEPRAQTVARGVSISVLRHLPTADSVARGVGTPVCRSCPPRTISRRFMSNLHVLVLTERDEFEPRLPRENPIFERNSCRFQHELGSVSDDVRNAQSIPFFFFFFFFFSRRASAIIRSRREISGTVFPPPPPPPPPRGKTCVRIAPATTDPTGLLATGAPRRGWSRSAAAACCRPARCAGTRGALRADRTTGAVRQPLRRERR